MKNINHLISQVKSTDNFYRCKVARTIDKFLVARNWLIGYYIIEYEQHGEDRAEYGSKLLQKLSGEIATKGLSVTNLKLFRQFYITYSEIGQTVSDLLSNTDFRISQTASDQSNSPDTIMQTPSAQFTKHYERLLDHLSFSHFVELMKISEPNKRLFYEIESTNGVWSVRELKRQINSLTFERSTAAKNPKTVLSKLTSDAEPLTAEQIIKTPYVFDFLGLPDHILGSESDLEKALIDDLKHFILELGHGFCFEAQQKRIIIGGEYFFIDLVFYHRILKCHVLIELKIEEFTHANAGQLNTYLQYYEKNIKDKTDKPPVGILLCTNKNDELVEYALGGMDNQLFVSQYQTMLPSKEQLEAFLQKERQKL